MICAYFILCRSLCDMNSTGFLNKEQFALCMWLIEEKSARGKDPPPQLTPEMVPPSMRASATAAEKPVSYTRRHIICLWLQCI